MPKLGFKLWARNTRKKALLFVKKQLENLNPLATIIIAIWGIWLTYRGNNLSKAAFELAKNDSSQQKQLEELKNIAKISQSQIDTLVQIIDELRELNSSSKETSKIASRTSRPVLNILENNLNQNEFKLEHYITIENVGQSTAAELSVTSIVSSFSNKKIISHEVLERIEPINPKTLSPSSNSQWLFKSIKKYTTDSLILTIRCIYLDDRINSRDTVYFHLRSLTNSYTGDRYEEVGGLLKANLIKYLRGNGL